ncbi:forkhead box protein N1 [Danio rerio]|uniref:Forkhead box protein N1 n=1 Tax=Danio rerio TaxID=7955 RepID=Q7ZTC0_DANRE|nr:forkhead box protein N1 [Danio rerio]CAD56910.1 winged helix nude b protein [Danio rerio]|eukprot:NP_997738.1 forkhead box protein N1 [Danio rerio]
MSSEPQGLSFLSISSSSSSPSPSPGQLQSFDPLESPCFQMPESQCHQSNGGEEFVPYSQRESDPYSQKSAERFRRHSVDGSPVGRDCDLTENSHYHPYRRQCSEGAISEGQPFSCVRRAGLAREIASADGLEEQSSWTTLGTDVETTSIMGTRRPYSEPQESSEEPPGYTTVNHQSYSAISPLQHQYYPSRGIDTVSHYYNQSLSTQTSQDSSPQPLYPKPVYSYSILIFLALRNSKTGSLPVSEIYSFMTEHFPYFKTAPDGWKNSVRHNLSLNKCFEKVENKNGNSSRKGCLWALNPAKVEKMQEELHKWRRKDPLTVRRSMARPEELERLLGERPEKLKSHFSLPSSHTHSQPFRVNMHPAYGHQPVHENRILNQKALYNPLTSQNAVLPPPYISPDPLAFQYYSPATHQPSVGHPSSPRTGSLDSPLPAHTPPSYSTALQAGHSGTASMQELLLDGEINNDVDALNPSLTDLQLHGSLWEELRNDSLAPDSLIVMDSASSLAQLSPPPARDSAGVCAETEDGVQGSISELYLSSFYTTAFTSAENMPGLISSQANTAIPLL